jgi:hypothetical protein
VSEENIAEMPERPERPSRLQAAIREARLTEAERNDVIVDLREAEIARLELLRDALADVFDEIPPDNDLLECELIPGNPPRLWIDVLAYVAMGRDKRTYRFIKDTRHGRQVILETAHPEEMADRVTGYVAHRIIERQRALETDEDLRGDAEHASTAAPIADVTPQTSSKRFGWGAVTLTFLLGLLAGAAGLFALGLVLIAS